MNKKCILVIDIGNSYTKIGAFEKETDKNLKTIMFDTKMNSNQFFVKTKIKEFLKIKTISCSIIGSVVPMWKKTYLEIIEKIFNFKPYEINNNTKYSFQIDKNINEQIADDLLALSEFCSSKSDNAVGFSFGTAISSILIEQKILKGVFISPGLSFGIDHLISKAHLLKKIKYVKNSNLVYGTSTKTAIEAGYFNIKRGIVLNVLESIDYFQKKHYCLFSGGEAADMIFSNYKCEVNKDAILLGFKYIYYLNN